ncbi:MAG: SPFH domain, Band 7 family protein [uncultured Thiotrichaceae bacterium]|uniref:SPFH domain, Band 7 family protein n=1 Tax=uncultured Thiotrichaceae bacterium TaxID=298394 RepID=A0A6S6S5N5_9GAMM|nr:MAG: SPFH domain, Band 7 family protein [uncultured Thiotrichaceae bacterium]
MENNEIPSASLQFKRWLRRKFPLLFILILIVALTLVFFWQRVVIVIDSGEAGILFRVFSGTEIDQVYAEGVHIFNPLDTLYIYEVRKQVAYHDFDVISNKGLTVNLSLAIRFRPEYELLGILHQQIGPDYLNRVIIPQIESVMRKELGNYTADQIYTNEEGLLTNAILTALDEVGRNYVEVEDIIIRSITLPPQLVKSIEDKLRQEEFMKSYEFRQQTAQKEAERLAIEAEGIKSYHQIIDESLTESVLLHKGILATEALAKSPNAKVVVIGGGKNGLPIILNTDTARTEALPNDEKNRMSESDSAGVNNDNAANSTGLDEKP